MTEKDTPFEDLFGESSRRSIMKKGALASGVAALGLTSSGSAIGQQQAPSTALVFVNDYHPEVQFQVVSRIQQTTVNQILGGQNGGQQQAPINDPTDYNGYIYNYTGCGPGNYSLVFVRDQSLQEGQSYSFGTDATFFSTQIQLLETDLQTGGGGGGGGGNQSVGGGTS